VLGYGGGSERDKPQDSDEDKRKNEQRRRDQRQGAIYDQTSPVQILAAGALSDIQTEALIYAKKKDVR